MSMKTKNFIIGKPYKITFEDHTCGTNQIMTIDVVGWVVEVTDKKVVVSHWKVDSEDKDLVESNYEYTTIIRKTILSKRVIRPR